MSLWTPPPTINSEKSNSENCSLPKEIVNKITNFDDTFCPIREISPFLASNAYFSGN